MANSALYMHYPLQEQFKQNPKPTVSVQKRLLCAIHLLLKTEHLPRQAREKRIMIS